MWGNIYAGVDEPYVSPQQVCKSITAKELAFGECHSLVLSNKGKVYTFGVNEKSVLGNPLIPKGSIRNASSPNEVSLKDIISIASFEYNCAAVSSKGEIFYWGKSLDSEIEISKPVKHFIPDVKFVRVSIGSNFMIALSGEPFLPFYYSKTFLICLFSKKMGRLCIQWE